VSRYAGKVAIVTGGAGGIGRAPARRLASEGASSLLADLAGPGLEESAQGVEGARDVATLTTDVIREEVVKHIVRRRDLAVRRSRSARQQCGHIEGVVAPIEESPVEVFDRVLRSERARRLAGSSHVMPASTVNSELVT